MIFEAIDLNHKGIVPVKMFLDTSNDNMLDPGHHNTFALNELRNKIGSQLKSKRQETKLLDSARHTKQHISRYFRTLDPESTGYLSKETFMKAFGPRYLGLSISDTEQDQIFNELMVIHKNKVNHFKLNLHS